MEVIWYTAADHQPATEEILASPDKGGRIIGRYGPFQIYFRTPLVYKDGSELWKAYAVCPFGLGRADIYLLWSRGDRRDAIKAVEEFFKRHENYSNKSYFQ